jgi:outer membrane protein TolC
VDGSGLPHDDASTAAHRNFLPELEANAMISATLSRCFGIFALLSITSATQYGAEARKLSLKEAVELAISQNHSLRIARLKIVENQQRKAGEHASYFPSIKDSANADDSTGIDHLVIPAGTFGRVQGQLVPGSEVSIPQGLHHLLLNEASISQPLTQLIRIHEANRIAASEVAISRAELRKDENQVAVDVHRLYFAILIAALQKRAGEEQIAYAKEELKENVDAVRKGSLLRVSEIQGNTDVLQGQQAVLTADLQVTDLNTELNDLLGLPLDTKLDLEPIEAIGPDRRPLEEYVQAAWANNPEIASAEESIKKARAAVTGAKSAFIPDITAYASDTWQNGVPFVVTNFGTVGVRLNYDVFDFGKRRAAVRGRDAQLAEAEENLTRLKDSISAQVERNYNAVERTKNLMAVADKVVALRRENERLSHNQVTEGVVTVASTLEASSATYKSQVDLLQANLNYMLAWAELKQTIGQTPGL